MQKRVPRGEAGATTLIVLMFLVTFLLRMTGNMVQTTIPLFARGYLGMNEAGIGTVSAVYTAAGVFAPILIVSRIRITRLSSALIGYSALFTGLVPLFFLVHDSLDLYILTASTSIAASTVMPLMLISAQTMNTAYAHRVIGTYTVALSTSLVFGPLLEGLLATHFGGVGIVFIAFCPFVLAATLLLIAGKWIGERRGNASHADDERLRKGGAVLRFEDAARVWKSRDFIVPALGQLGYSVVFAAILSFGGILAENNINAGYGEVFLLFAIFFSSSLAVRILLTLLPDPRRKVDLIHLAMIVSMAGLLMIEFSRNDAAMYLAFGILGVPHGLQYPVTTMMIAERMKREDLPMVNAFFAATGAASMALTPLLIGILSLSYGLTASMAFLVVPVGVLWAAFSAVSRGWQQRR